MLTGERSRKKVLGILLGDRAAVVAEVAGAGKAAQVLRIAEFIYPKGMALDQAEALGSALREFLNAGGFSSRRAVFGTPAKWLVLKPHTLPPADEATAQSLLALHAETHSPPELGAIAFDYAGRADAHVASSVLLMGLPRKCLDRVLALAQSARLKPIAITPGVAALAAATARQVESPLVLSLGAHGAELAAQEGSQTCYVRHLGASTAVSALSIELRRAAATLPNGWGISHGNSRPQVGGSRSLVLWDDVGLDSAAIESLESSLSMPVVRGQLSTLSASGAALSATRSGAAAVALALPAVRGQRPVVDFLHPRVAPPKPKRVSTRVYWTSVAAASVVLCAAVAWADLARLHYQIDNANSDIKKLEPRLKIAEPFVNSMRFADGFVETRPRHLACLRDVTVALPPDGQTYLSGFHLQTNMKGEISGRANDNPSVVALKDKLHATKRFTNLNVRTDARDSHGSASGVSYTITFTYVPQT